MNRSQSKIRHIQQVNFLLEQRRFGLLSEDGNQPVMSQFIQDFGKILSIQPSYLLPMDIDLYQNDENKFMENYKKVFPNAKNLQDATHKMFVDVNNLIKQSMQNPEIVKNVYNQLNSYNGQMTPKQKVFFNQFKQYFQKAFTSQQQIYGLNSAQNTIDNIVNKLNNQNVQSNNNVEITNNTSDNDVDTTNNTSKEKINTTNDRSYDYKLSGGKYYYSTKGQNNWVEAKGKGLQSIKNKVTF